MDHEASFRELEQLTFEKDAPLRKPIPYPTGESPVDALRDVTQEYGRRKVPPNVPQALQEVIGRLRNQQNHVLLICTESIISTEALIKDLLDRVTRHEAYLAREAQIASVLRERADNLRKEITNEFTEPAKSPPTATENT